MNVNVLLFASAREAAGTAELVLDLPDGATVEDALAALANLHPGLAPLLPSCRTAVNEEFAPRNTVLPRDATLAILPPVSGG